MDYTHRHYPTFPQGNNNREDHGSTEKERNNKIYQSYNELIGLDFILTDESSELANW